MAQHIEFGPRGIPEVLSAVLHCFGRTRRVQELAAVEPVVAPPELAIQLPVEPPAVQVILEPSLSPREQRIRNYFTTPPGSGDPVPTKRKHIRANRPDAHGVSSSMQSEHGEVVRPRSLMITPRFAKEFEGLSPVERAEIKGALRVIAEGKGQWHPVRDVKRGVKLYTGREHAGKGDNLRIIFTPDKEELGSYYVLGIIQGHDYSVNTVRSFIESAKHVSSWLLDGKMIGLEAWLKSLT